MRWRNVGWIVMLSAVPAMAGESLEVSLFNGTNLAGWTPMNAGSFSVEDGMLVVDGGLGWIRTNREYDDFDLTVEWRADPRAKAENIVYDSGLYFRAGLEGKPFPTENYQVGMAEGKEGGVKNLHPEAAPKLVKPASEWNVFRVRAEGPNVELYINGELAWKTDQAKRLRGYIGIQAEHYRFEFRKIVLTELGMPNAFNGKDLTGWKAHGEPGKWRSDGDMLVNDGKGGWLHTEKAIRDAIFCLEFKVPKGGNSGVFLRSTPEGNPAFTGMEIQILDNDAYPPGALKPSQFTASLYASYAPTPNTFTQAGEWQSLLISCVGEKVMVWLNGMLVVDGDLTRPELVNRAKSGFFGLQDHDSKMEFRNVKLKVLDPPSQ